VLDNQQFLDILGIAQMTPGPMSVNTATFVGYR
jgi:chromate transporter